MQPKDRPLKIYQFLFSERLVICLNEDPGISYVSDNSVLPPAADIGCTLHVSRLVFPKYGIQLPGSASFSLYAIYTPAYAVVYVLLPDHLEAVYLTDLLLRAQLGLLYGSGPRHNFLSCYCIFGHHKMP